MKFSLSSSSRFHRIFIKLFLLVDPLGHDAAPARDLLRGEPQRYLLLRRLHAVAAVNDVAPDVDAVVAADSAGRRVLVRTKVIFMM